MELTLEPIKRPRITTMVLNNMVDRNAAITQLIEAVNEVGSELNQSKMHNINSHPPPPPAARQQKAPAPTEPSIAKRMRAQEDTEEEKETKKEAEEEAAPTKQTESEKTDLMPYKDRK